MFAYNPLVTDQSGAIIGQGKVNAAQTNAEAKVKLVDDIGGALVSLAGAYADNKAMDAKAKGYDQVGKILGDSMFKNNPAVGNYLSELRNVKNPMERISGYETLFGLAGPMSNAMMAQGRFGLQQQAPYVDQMLDNQRDVAGGKATWTPSGGGANTPAPVEPPLPGEEPLNPPPAVAAPGPVANPITDASRQRAMQWWQKRSQGGP